MKWTDSQKHKQLKLTQEEIEILNKAIPSKGTETQGKSIAIRRNGKALSGENTQFVQRMARRLEWPHRVSD